MRDRDRSTIHAIRGPILVITVGVLFALQNFTRYNFGETWPVLIIVIGLVSLLGRAIGPPPPTVPPPPPFSTYRPPQAPPATPPPGGYRQTPYAQSNDPRNNPGGPA